MPIEAVPWEAAAPREEAVPPVEAVPPGGEEEGGALREEAPRPWVAAAPREALWEEEAPPWVEATPGEERIAPPSLAGVLAAAEVLLAAGAPPLTSPLVHGRRAGWPLSSAGLGAGAAWGCSHFPERPFHTLPRGARPRGRFLSSHNYLVEFA